MGKARQRRRAVCRSVAASLPPGAGEDGEWPISFSTSEDTNSLTGTIGEFYAAGVIVGELYAACVIGCDGSIGHALNAASRPGFETVRPPHEREPLRNKVPFGTGSPF
jgi:hypothetical protein